MRLESAKPSAATEGSTSNKNNKRMVAANRQRVNGARHVSEILQKVLAQIGEGRAQ